MYLFAVNIAAYLFAVMYLILYSSSMIGMSLAENIESPAQSGLFVMLTYGRVIFIEGLCVILWVDIMWAGDVIKEHLAKKNKGWL
jgi:NADH:ubiquinone oxidoreductase subunit 6 (subunit J)